MKQKKEKIKEKKGEKSNIKLLDNIRNIWLYNPDKILNYKQICKMLGIVIMSDKRRVVEILEELVKSGELTQVELGRYISKSSKRQNVEGVVSIKGNKAYLHLDENDEYGIEIDTKYMYRFLAGDRVEAVIKGKKSPKAVVLSVIERANKTYIGTLEQFGENFFFIPKNRDLGTDIYIRKKYSAKAKNNMLVAVKVRSWDENSKSPEGEVVAVLGNKGDNNTEMHAILMEYGLPYSYPKEIEAEAEKFSDEIDESELAKRRDFRDVTCFTIDPKDAKDFDDALSIRTLKNGNIEVGVHIADVSHFVKEGSIIDQEAYSRATSVYLVDRTIPMLPERLSNYLCSLRPNEDKYSYSCIFEMNNDADVLSYEIVRTVIRSQKRMTYEEAQEQIETKTGEYAAELEVLNNLAIKLRERRFESGSIAFERQELGFEIDENGKPIATKVKVQKEAHKLIEEFMLLANRTVAEHIAKMDKKRTFVYRVHDNPDEEKIRSLGSFAMKFSYKFDANQKGRELGRNINSLLNLSQGKVESNLLSIIAIRAMAKAVYTTKNIGHYGLAFDYYTHFTSPIRRYPDLIVHRLLDRYINEGKNSVDQKEYEEYSEHSSKMEQLAASAERESIKYKQVEFMQDKLGFEFDAIISGVTEWGIYADIEENHCEGMIALRNLNDDYYIFDAEDYAVYGEKTRKRYTLGDKIRIKVVSANLERKQLDFVLV